ncbi:nucleoside recognition GATE domain-containing membrane protein YjiH [Salinibacillus kushneri]|uniref:Nucleoside recognition GATE domain-containing membrane protein YjiH n=1 Tax=Salinibacillus kushneri TaxID=237682 RepID=A0A1I0CQ04_9BACI|nr:YjiH family protein [Salinibacillus kushneri]SET21829.1 nucleoside recognition GATE domain-containing membrane protein YjiH [Salinibacillus kushneri]
MKRYFLIDHLKFIVPSLLGIFLFMIPFSYKGQITIPIAIFANWLQALIGDYLTAIMTIIITLTAIFTLLYKWILRKNPNALSFSPFFIGLFHVTTFWTIVRILGAILAILTYFQVGPEAIYSEDTGGMLLGDLLHILFSVFLFAGLLLPLLLNFGLLELFGTLLQKVMRPLFTLPGRSSIDNLASWLGDGTIGVLLTSKQYEQGYYTKREAAVIGTTFSVVSITFCIVVIEQVNLEHLFIPFYLTVLAAGLVAGIIMPRIPPLSRFPNQYHNGDRQKRENDEIEKGQSRWRYGYEQALAKASKSKGITHYLKEGSQNVLDMWMGVAPIVMTFGTFALVLANYTPFFTWLGYPFIPLLELMQLPEAKAASETLLIGFADMFLPAILIESVNSELTRFVIACLSVSQLIYMSEVGGLILGSKIPVRFTHLIVIFLLRTVISLPIIILIGHFIF